MSNGYESVKNDETFKGGELWAVFVGVNQYRDQAVTNLNYCENDAKGLSSLFINADTTGYESSNIRILSDSVKDNSLLPTRNNIISTVHNLAQIADTEDTILFGFFGHGLDTNGTSYLFASDSEHSCPQDTAIELNWIKNTLQNSHASTKILVIDACHSGSLRGRHYSGMSETFADALKELCNNEGWAVLSACKQNQISQECNEKKHGVFTYYLIEGLLGRADSNQDGLITLFEANEYANRNTKRWAFEKGYEQTPEFHCNITGDIILFNRNQIIPTKEMPIITAMGSKGGAGKSTVISGIAELIASAGKKVLIIDADIETAGVSKYLSSRAISQPNVWTVMDAAYAKQNNEKGKIDNNFWKVTPTYLNHSRFGDIYLIPGRLQSDSRNPYNAMANIQPDTRRNEAAIEILREMIELAEKKGIDLILIDSGAENNPLVSAGFVLGTYGFLISSPNPEFRVESNRLDSMHRERYPQENFNSMAVIVNQATYETISLWQDKNIHIIREDPLMRRMAALGNFDFEGIGLCPFYIDVLLILISCFKEKHKEFLPDEGEVWVKPFLKKMKSFPQKLLESWQYKYLNFITTSVVLFVFLIGIISAWTILESNKFGKDVEISREITTQSEQLHELNQITIPKEFIDRVWLKDNKLYFKGPISEIERAQLKALSSFSDFQDVVVEGALIINDKVKNASMANEQKRQIALIGLLSGIIILSVQAYLHRKLSKRKKFLIKIIFILEKEQKEENIKLIKQILGEETGKFQLGWLKETFLEKNPNLENFL